VRKESSRDGAKEISGPARDVDDYLAAVREEARATLEKLRKAIRSAVPKAIDPLPTGQVPSHVARAKAG
jgi:hypothetical protein